MKFAIILVAVCVVFGFPAYSPKHYTLEKRSNKTFQDVDEFPFCLLSSYWRLHFMFAFQFEQHNEMRFKQQ